MATATSGSIPNPEQVRGAEFPTVRRNGYDTERVRAYLVDLAGWIGSFQVALADARARAERAEGELLKASQEPKSEATVQLAARARARELVRHAEAEVDRVLKESHALLEDARSRAEAIGREPAARVSEAEPARTPDPSLEDVGLAREYADVLLEAGKQLDASLASIQGRLSGSVEQLEVPRPDAEERTAEVEEPAEAEGPAEAGDSTNVFDENEESGEAEAPTAPTAPDEDLLHLFDEREAKLDTDLKSLRELFVENEP